MAGLATGAKKAGVAGVKQDFSEWEVGVGDDSHSHIFCSESVYSIAQLCRQSKERRFDGVDVGTVLRLAGWSFLACRGAYSHSSHSRSSGDSGSESVKQCCVIGGGMIWVEREVEEVGWVQTSGTLEDAARRFRAADLSCFHFSAAFPDSMLTDSIREHASVAQRLDLDSCSLRLDVHSDSHTWLCWLQESAETLALRLL